MMNSKQSRRQFVGTTAAAGAGVWLGTTAQSRAYRSPLQELAGACIGVGGKGESDSRHISELDVNLVGICDVDRNELKKKGIREKSAEQFQDFREMLDKLGDKVDLVSVSTPDHTHAAAAMMAMNMKKHVYCQKPLTWSIQEARLLRETADKMGVITQMGNQGTSEDGLRSAVEVIRSGAIGEVTAVHVWTDRPIWPQGQGRSETSDDVPAYLNWDAWIGPAPMRPFVGKKAYHPFNWRGWLDFGTGALGDMACHTTNMPVKALELWDPIAVTALNNSGIAAGEQYPSSSSLKFEFPERGGLAATDFYWYDGGNLPDDSLLAMIKNDGFQKKIADKKAGKPGSDRGYSGALIIGSKGIVFSPNDYGAKYDVTIEDKLVVKDGQPVGGYQMPEQTLPRIPFQNGTDERQKWEFVKSITGEYEHGTMSNFGYAGRLTETMLVGILAIRGEVGKRYEWDAKGLTCTNDPEMNQFVGREYRDGWKLG